MQLYLHSSIHLRHVAFNIEYKAVSLHTMKAYKESGGRTPLILNFSTTWTCVVNLTPRPPLLSGKDLRYPFKVYCHYGDSNTE